MINSIIKHVCVNNMTKRKIERNDKCQWGICTVWMSKIRTILKETFFCVDPFKVEL